MKVYEGVIYDDPIFHELEEDALPQMLTVSSSLAAISQTIDFKIDDVLKRQKNVCSFTLLTEQNELLSFVIEEPLGFVSRGDRVIVIGERYSIVKKIGVSDFKVAAVVFRVKNDGVVTIGCASRRKFKEQVASESILARIERVGSCIKSFYREERRIFKIVDRKLDKRFDMFIEGLTQKSKNALLIIEGVEFKNVKKEDANMFLGWYLKGKVLKTLVLDKKVIDRLKLKYSKYRIDVNIFMVDDVVLENDKSEGKVYLKGIVENVSDDRTLEGVVERSYPIVLRGSPEVIEKIGGGYTDLELINMYFSNLVYVLSRFEMKPGTKYFAGFIVEKLLKTIGKYTHKPLKERIERIQKAFQGIVAEVGDLRDQGLPFFLIPPFLNPRYTSIYGVRLPVVRNTPLLTAFLVKLKGRENYIIVLTYPLIKNGSGIPLVGERIRFQRISDLGLYRPAERQVNDKPETVEVYLSSNKIPIHPKGTARDSQYRSFLAFLKNPEHIVNLHLEDVIKKASPRFLGRAPKISRYAYRKFHCVLANNLSEREKDLEFIGPYVYCEGIRQNNPVVFVLKEYPISRIAGPQRVRVINRGGKLYEVVD